MNHQDWREDAARGCYGKTTILSAVNAILFSVYQYQQELHREPDSLFTDDYIEGYLEYLLERAE